MLAAVPASPPNPKRAATSAITKNKTASFNMPVILSLVREPVNNPILGFTIDYIAHFALRPYQSG